MAKDFDILQQFSKCLINNGDGTFSLRSSGGGGGTPGGSSGDIQYNNAGAFGGYTTVPLANAGWGITNTRTNITTSGTTNNQAVASVWLNFTSSTTSTITGFVAQADGTQIIITNAGGSNFVTLAHQNGSSSAANRIIVPGNTNLNIPVGYGITLRYSGTVGRWVFVSGYPYAASGIDGILSGTKYNEFQAKVGGAGLANRLAIWSGTSTIGYDTNLFWSSPLASLGVQTTTPLAVWHVASSLITDVTPPSIVSSTQVNAATNASNLTATQVDGSGSRTSNGSHSIDYKIYPYVNVGSTKIVNTALAQINFTDSNSAAQFIVQLDWTASTIADGYIIERFEGSFFYIDVGSAVTYNDDAFADDGSSVAVTNSTIGLFTANNTTYSFTTGGIALGLLGNVYYSITPGNVTPTDDNTGNAFFWVHSVSAIPTNGYKMVNDTSSIGKTFTSSDTTIIAGSSNFVESTSLTPAGYYKPTALLEGHGSSLADSSILALKSIDGSYGRLEFLDSANSRLGYIEQAPTTFKTVSFGSDITFNSSGLFLSGGSGAGSMTANTISLNAITSGSIAKNAAPRFTWNGTGLSFFSATPVAQQGATTDLGVALSNLGLRASGTAYPITTSGAVTLGSLTSTRIPITGTAGLLGDDADLTFTGGDTLNATKVISSSLTASKVVLTDGSKQLISSTSALLVAAGIPNVVASSDLTNQSAAIGATTLFAVETTGHYRLSWSATVTTAASTSSALGGTQGFTPKYTSPTDSVVKTDQFTNPTISAGNTTGTSVSGSTTAYCKTGTNLQYLFGYTSVGLTAMVYELHVTVEFIRT